MDRCPECGFLAEEYNSFGRKGLPEVLEVRLELALAGAEGHDPAATRARLAELLSGDEAGGLHEAHHFVSALSRETAKAALEGRMLAGTVVQINRSDGGLPKVPVPQAQVGWRGLVGDRQRDRKHHGHPGQALCLYSLEVIEALQEEGHPIAAGSSGENLTLAGLDWSSMRPGIRFRAGPSEDGVVFEVTEPAVPCHNQRRWFSGGDFYRMSYDHHPGWSRWYASIVRPGRVETGDSVTLAP